MSPHSVVFIEEDLEPRMLSSMVEFLAPPQLCIPRAKYLHGLPGFRVDG